MVKYFLQLKKFQNAAILTRYCMRLIGYPNCTIRISHLHFFLPLNLLTAWIQHFEQQSSLSITIYRFLLWKSSKTDQKKNVFMPCIWLTQ